MQRLGQGNFCTWRAPREVVTVEGALGLN
jgi:hypothetical protein